ncbi:anthrone oxygenase family protein [Mucilaginibacter sp. AW1-3]
MRKQLFTFCTWWAVIGASIWIGGTVYMMCVINPQWSSNPPGTVRFFFTKTEFNQYIWYFFGPPFMVLRSILPQLLVLIFGWHSKVHRRYLLITLGCTLATVLYTVICIYPINDVLMFKAGGNNTAEAIGRMVKNWIFADRIRFAINLVGYYYLLMAFKQPLVN